MDSVRILGRRRLVFRYMSMHFSTQEIHRLVSPHYPCSPKTIQRDVRDVDQWLPSLLSLKEGEENEALAKILGNLQLARIRLLELMYQADNSNAMVGAAKGVAAIVAQEAEIRMDVGQIHRVPAGLRIEEGAPTYDVEELLDRMLEADDKRRAIVLKENL